MPVTAESLQHRGFTKQGSFHWK